MGVLFGLAAAFSWGLGDFLITQVSRRLGVAHTMFYYESTGLLLTIALLLLWPATPGGTPAIWALAFGVGLLNLGGTAFLYRAFNVGTVALVAPISSGYAVITALLALITGERPALIPLLGALLLSAGVIVVAWSQPHQGKATLAGLPEALGAACFYGVTFWALGYVTPVLGVLIPVLAIRLMKWSGAIAGLMVGGRRPARLSWVTAPLVVGGSVFGTLGFVTFNLGASTAYTSIVTPIASLSSAVTVFFAWSLLREHLTPGQWLGIAIILTGVVLVSS